MKYELNLIKTTLNGYIIERKNIIENLRGMASDEILNILSEKEISFDGINIVYLDSLMRLLNDMETYLTDIVGFYPDAYVGLEVLEDTVVHH